MSTAVDRSIPLVAGATLHPLSLPARADAADAAELREFAAMRNRLYRELRGRADEDLTARELLPMLRSTPDQATYSWAVRREGELIGRAGLNVPLSAGAQRAFGFIELFPAVWGEGIASAVLPHLESVSLSHGRTMLQAWAEQPPSDGPHLSAPTGFGSVPDDHISRFLQRHGFTLEQVVRASALELSDDNLAAIRSLRDEAERASNEYRVVQWMTPTPPEFADGYAWMKSRMVIDVPSAGLGYDEEEWDAARVARMDRDRAEGGYIFQITAAQHITTGELCAFNELRFASDPDASTHQHDTLVLAGHRGHRLGMLIKCAALLTWKNVAPLSPRVITYNAEENRPMLAINEALGFRPFAYEGAWTKDLT